MTKENIDKEEFNKIKEQALIIDVRDKLEHQDLKSFPNSINVPYKDLIAEPEKYLPDKNKLIIAYCNFGNLSITLQKISVHFLVLSRLLCNYSLSEKW